MSERNDLDKLIDKYNCLQIKQDLIEAYKLGRLDSVYKKEEENGLQENQESN